MAATIARQYTPADECRARVDHAQRMVRIHRQRWKAANDERNAVMAHRHQAEVIRWESRLADAKRELKGWGG